MTTRIAGLSAAGSDYRAILCDVWGVLHNGVSVYRDAETALVNYRQNGGKVVLLTNSPRPNDGVMAQLDQIEVSRDAYDEIVTSGDVTRQLIADAEGPIFHLGPQRDLPLFEGQNAELSDEEVCQTIVCTGLFEDETEMPEDYRQRLESLAAREIPLICANPDLVVERGDRLIYCAGSLAQLYRELGGETRVAGKPHAPIYKLAMQKLAELEGAEADKKNVLAIGDGMPTDVAGAIGNGFDLLYISAGIHSVEYGSPLDPDEARLEAFLRQNNVDPTLWMPRLIWQAEASNG